MIWLVPALGALAVGFWLRPVTTDEAWSLVVSRRMLRGERIYRDVFYGAAPLAIVIQALACRAMRPQIVVVRGLTAVYIALHLIGAVELVGSTSGTSAAVVGLLVGAGGLHLAVSNHYGRFSMLAVEWAAVAIAHGRPSLAGLLIGISLLGRYTVGVVAAPALALVVLAETGWSDAFALLGATFVAPAIVIGLRPTSVRWFLRRAVFNKRGYVRAGSVRPNEWILGRPWRKDGRSLVDAGMVGALVVASLAPVVSVVALADGRDHAGLALALSVIGGSTLVPRGDGIHAVAAVGLSAPSLVVASPADALGVVAVVAWVLAIVGIIGLVLSTRRRPVRRNVPGLRWLPVQRLSDGVWPDETAGVPDEAFLLRIDASLVYACGSIRNPTPFDYPARSTFGEAGQQEVTAAIDAGLPVCVNWKNRGSPLAPIELLDHVDTLEGRHVPLGRLIER